MTKKHVTEHIKLTKLTKNNEWNEWNLNPLIKTPNRDMMKRNNKQHFHNFRISSFPSNDSNLCKNEFFSKDLSSKIVLKMKIYYRTCVWLKRMMKFLMTKKNNETTRNAIKLLYPRLASKSFKIKFVKFQRG